MLTYGISLLRKERLTYERETSRTTKEDEPKAQVQGTGVRESRCSARLLPDALHLLSSRGSQRRWNPSEGTSADRQIRPRREMYFAWMRGISKKSWHVQQAHASKTGWDNRRAREPAPRTCTLYQTSYQGQMGGSTRVRLGASSAWSSVCSPRRNDPGAPSRDGAAPRVLFGPRRVLGPSQRRGSLEQRSCQPRSDERPESFRRRASSGFSHSSRALRSSALAASRSARWSASVARVLQGFCSHQPGG